MKRRNTTTEQPSRENTRERGTDYPLQDLETTFLLNELTEDFITVRPRTLYGSDEI